MLSLDLNCRSGGEPKLVRDSALFPFKENGKHLLSVRLCKELTGDTAVKRETGPWSQVPGSPAHSGSSGTHLSLGQQRGVLEHVHDDDKEFIHPLSHFQAANLHNGRTTAEG